MLVNIIVISVRIAVDVQSSGACCPRYIMNTFTVSHVLDRNTVGLMEVLHASITLITGSVIEKSFGREPCFAL